MVSGALLSLSDITVTLNVSGGYNGDLYPYLSHHGALVLLSNRIGVSASNPHGASGAGMDVTPADWGPIVDGYNGNIHTAGNAWVALATVTLTNTSQLYFDASAPGQPERLYRLVQVP